MNTQIEIWNGSGWNNYQALRHLRHLPVGTRTLMRKNSVSRLTVSPASLDKPFGISARYYDSDGNNVYTQHFDQNCSAAWIKERITLALNEGIQFRVEKLRSAAAAAAEAKAVAAGHATAAEHSIALIAKAEAERAEKAAARNKLINDAAAAESAFRDAVAAVRLGAVSVTRKGDFRTADDVTVGYLDRDELYAWLHLNGHHVGIDFRQNIINAAQNLLPIL